MRKIKTWIVTIIGMILIAALCACSGNGQGVASETTATVPETTVAPATADTAKSEETTTEEETTTAEELVDMKVGICFSDHTNANFIALLDSARNYAEEHDNVTIIEQDGKSDANTIVSAIENFINSGCDAIIYQNSWPEVTDNIVDEALEAGICVMAYNTENPNATFSWLSDDKTIGNAVGNMAGEWINKNCEGKGKVYVVCNDAIAYLKARGDAMVEGILEVAPDTEFIGRQAARDLTAGYTLAETVISSNPEVNCWVCTGDEAAVGVSMAYEVAGWTDPIGTFGCNATQEAITAMKEDGTFISGTIDLQLPLQMVRMLDTCYEYVAHGTVEQRVVIMEVKPVTKENVSEY